MNLEQTIERFKDNDIDAFERIYNMYQKSLLGVIFVIVKDEGLAAEVLQDVFLKAWQNADTYDKKKGRLFTWILNIARNAAIDKVRSKNYKNNQKNQPADNFVHILQTHNNLDRQTNAIGLRTIVEKLKEKCKDIIDLIYFKGFTQKETAESLDIPLGTVKTRNRNCIDKLRKMLNH